MPLTMTWNISSEDAMTYNALVFYSPVTVAMTWSRDLIAADSLFNSMLHMEDTDGTTASDPSRHWVDHDV